MNSTANTARSETSGLTKRANGEQSVTLNWTLQRLNRTWFISPLDEQIVLIEHPVSNGASDEQWRSLVRGTGVRIKSKDDSRPWGPMARRDFLNMVENTCPNRMPRLFDSREAASKWLEDRKAASNNEDTPPEEGA